MSTAVRPQPESTLVREPLQRKAAQGPARPCERSQSTCLSLRSEATGLTPPISGISRTPLLLSDGQPLLQLRDRSIHPGYHRQTVRGKPSLQASIHDVTCTPPPLRRTCRPYCTCRRSLCQSNSGENPEYQVEIAFEGPGSRAMQYLLWSTL